MTSQEEAYADPPRVARGGVSKSESRAKEREYQRRYYEGLKARAVTTLGGKCRRCGTTGTEENWLEFHYLPGHDPATHAYTRFRMVLANPSPWLLLCRKHHLDTHIRQIKKTRRADPTSGMDIRAAMSLKAHSTAKRERLSSIQRHFGSLTPSKASPGEAKE